MKILLVAVPIMEPINGSLEPIMMDKTRANPPYGLYLLAEMVRQAGHDVDILDLIARGGLYKEEIQQTVSQYDILGISANSLNWSTARELIRIVRESKCDIPIVLGGIHGTLYDDYILHHYPIDFVVRGEGEKVLPELIRYFDGKRSLSGISGLSYLNGRGQFIRHQESELLSICELENLPAPAYDLLPSGVYEGISIESARGCAFACSFCSIPFKRCWRALSAERFIERVKQLQPYVSKSITNAFSLIDDCFTIDNQRVVDIVNGIENRGLYFQAALDARCSDVQTLEFGHVLGRITNVVMFGAECGYDEGLKRVGKGLTTKTIERAAQLVAEAGYSDRTVFSFILGLPWERYQDVLQTVKFAGRLAARFGITLYLQWHCLIPGSKIWNELHRRGEVDISMYDEFGFFHNPYLTFKGISLSREEVFKIGEKIVGLIKLLKCLNFKRELIEFSIPPPYREKLADNKKPCLTTSKSG